MANSKIPAIVGEYEEIIDRLDARIIARLNAAIDTSYRELEREFLRLYPQIADKTNLLPSQQRAVLMADLGDLLQVIDPAQAPNYEQTFQQAYAQASEVGVRQAREMQRAIAPDSFVRQFTGVPLDAVAAQAQDSVRRLYRYNAEFQNKASAVIEQSLIQGWGPRRAAGILRQEVGNTRYAAERIARTETSAALNTAAQQRYKAAGLEYFQWMATPSEAACPFCVARNMQVYAVGAAQIPAHPHCRCVALPWRTEWAEEGLIDADFDRAYHAQMVAELGALGKQPNEGLTPFERAAGLSAPPAPVWVPGDRQLSIPTPPAPIEKFPQGIENLEVVRELGGSTGAQLVRDPATGQQYVLKRGANAGHLREEFAADRAYRALGVDVPDARLYETATGPAKLAEFIDGRPLSALQGQELAAARARLREHFAADSLLGNWDVVGLSGDNVLVGRDGRVWRIDNGGALRYRAMGDPKGAAWNPYPTELWSLRDANINPQAAQVFGALDWDAVIGQSDALESRRADLIAALPTELRGVMGQRLDEIVRLTRINRTMAADDFIPSYRDQFSRHVLGIRQAGITDRLPREMRLGSRNRVYDESDRLFDHLRGQDSVVNDLSRYIAQNGGEYEQISDWMAEQARSSWSDESQALKAFIAEARGGNRARYYWHYGDGQAEHWLTEGRRLYRNYDDTFTAFHAFNYEAASRIAMPNNDIQRGMWRIYRTEGADILNSNKVTIGDNRIMRRGAAESGSAFTPISAVAGDELTIQDVPHHRILGMYLQAREPGADRGAFLGDKENEIVFIPEGLPFSYVGQLDTSYSATANYTEPP